MEREALRPRAGAQGEVARELERQKADFLATTSHELKAPLTAVIGHTQLLRRSVRAGVKRARIEAGLEEIDAHAHALARLLDDLLDASRLLAGGFVLGKSLSDLADSARRVVARLTPRDRRRIRLSVDDDLRGVWDPKRLEQVLANLVDNALKYSPAGSPVVLSAKRASDQVEVRVTDRGVGIRPDELPLVFDQFFRTHEALESGVQGSGLGLYICRQIIAAHGGRLRAESRGEGQGATFAFTLPVSLEGEVSGATDGR